MDALCQIFSPATPVEKRRRRQWQPVISYVALAATRQSFISGIKNACRFFLCLLASRLVVQLSLSLSTSHASTPAPLMPRLLLFLDRPHAQRVRKYTDHRAPAHYPQSLLCCGLFPCFSSCILTPLFTSLSLSVSCPLPLVNYAAAGGLSSLI